MKKKLEIILPVYREEDTIRKTLSEIQTHVLTPHSIRVIYDSEKDPTVAILKSLNKKHKNLILVKNIYKSGVVNALRTGLETSRAAIIVIMMADRSDNPRDIDKMVKKIDQGYDFVCASRYMKQGNRIGGPFLKGKMSYIACKSLRLVTGIPTNDATNAFKCFKRKILDDITIESVGGFEFPLELTVKAYNQDYKITEIPTVWRERTEGSSKFKLLHWLPQYLRWYFYALSIHFRKILF